MLARINTTEREEMRLWLTRRLLAGLWPLMNRVVGEHLLKHELAGAALTGQDDQLKKMLTDFRKEELLQHADFQTPYADRQDKLPLGEEPLLVTDVDLTPLADGRIQMGFTERVPGTEKVRGFQVELDPKAVQGFMHLLDQALAHSQWREGFSNTDAPESPSETPGEEPPTSKPRYLN